MKRQILYLIACVIGLTATLRAEEAPASTNPAPAVAAEKPAPAPEAPAKAAEAPAEPAEPEQIIIDYHEADIQNIVRSLATKAGVNLIVGEQVIGKVTVHLEGVSYEDAMRAIAESKGYAYVKSKNVVQIKTKESLDAEPVEARIFILNYAKADEVKKSMDLLLSKQGKIQIDPRANALVISDTPSSLTRIQPLIEKLDTETKQVMIEAKFVETTRNPKKDLGVNLSATLIDHKFSAGPFSLSKDLAGGPWVPSTALLDAGSASLLFSFMSTDADTELLASPRVVTTDNAKAKIAIATEYPIPQFTYSESKGAFSISGFEYKDIGIVLNCTPHINKDNFVTLDVVPEAGSQSGVASFQGVDIPIIENRTAKTTVLIKSGNTLAMGGLTRQDSSDKRTKVPVLGDIPGVGALFRSKSVSKNRRELLIFLTPTIIAPDGKTGLEQFYNGIPDHKVTANDDWMPNDNARPDPSNFLPWKKSQAQNFGPK